MRARLLNNTKNGRFFEKGVFFERLTLCILAAMLLIVLPLYSSMQASAAPKDDEDLEKQLSESILNQLESLDLYELEEIIRKLGETEGGLFGSKSFIDRVQAVLAGDFKIGYDSFFQAAVGLVFYDILSFLPILASIIAVCILSGILTSMRSKEQTVINLACYGVIVIILFASLLQLVIMTKDTVNATRAQMQAVFPILLTLMVAMGANASAAVYQPAVAIASELVTEVFVSIVLPIFIITIALNFVGNLSQNIKLTKLSAFFSGLQKWIVGLVLAVFIAFLAVQGITAAAYDSVSIRTAKYAVSHYIPIVGGFLSDGFNLILASGMLIKNAVGLSSILLLASTILSPVVKIAVFSLCLKLTAAIIEPICDKKLTEFTFSISKSLASLAAVILVVAFMYFIILMLIISTANYVGAM